MKLTKKQKADIDKVIDKALKEYSKTFELLSKE